MKLALTDALQDLEGGDREVHAFLPEPGRRRRVLEEVRDLDAETQSDLLGMMVGVKDIINVDGLPTQAGSPLPASLFEGPEATMVGRLRDAGALIAGKTTTTEFAFSEPPTTRNPRNLEHTPGGSSSGSAAAVVAGLVPLALGTQTVDSIVTPAAYCGVVGFKPTYQRFPLDGVIPFSPSMDHGGLLAADVTTAQMAASVVCDAWGPEPQSSDPVLGILAPDYIHRADPSAVTAFEATIGILQTRGFSIVETQALLNLDAIATAHRRLIAAEFARIHTDWFTRFGDRYRPRTARLYAEGEALPETVITAGRESGEELRGTLQDTMQREGISAWISPAATGVAPRGLDYIGDPTMALPWTHSHLPVVTLPTTLSLDGLPLGIQLTGRINEDEELLALASLLEAALSRK